MLIGLHGKAGAGKDTVAEHLFHRHGFARISFAGPLKDMLIVFGVNRSLMNGADKEKVIDWIGKSPRQLMQTLGTEWGRGQIADDIWIRHAAHRMDVMRRISPHIVFTDVRFENEAAWIRSQGGQIWHVLRKLPENVTPMHLSEAGLGIADGDSVIPNHAGIDDLHDIVDEALVGGWTYDPTGDAA